MTTTGITEINIELESYLKRAKKRRAKDAAISAWHLEAYTEGGVELPYTDNDNYVTVTVQNYDASLDKYVVDEAATRAKLAKVARFATKKHCKVEKDYSYNFSLSITIADSDSPSGKVVVRYNADRETVCTKKVVGTKVVPATTTPERIEEIVEWDCEPVSLLAQK